MKKCSGFSLLMITLLSGMAAQAQQAPAGDPGAPSVSNAVGAAPAGAKERLPAEYRGGVSAAPFQGHRCISNPDAFSSTCMTKAC